MPQNDYNPCDACNMSCNSCEFGRVKEWAYKMEKILSEIRYDPILQDYIDPPTSRLINKATRDSSEPKPGLPNLQTTLIQVGQRRLSVPCMP